MAFNAYGPSVTCLASWCTGGIHFQNYCQDAKKKKIEMFDSWIHSIHWPPPKFSVSLTRLKLSSHENQVLYIQTFFIIMNSIICRSYHPHILALLINSTEAGNLLRGHSTVIAPKHPYASETAFSRIENAFSNFRNAVSAAEKRNRAGMCEETNSSSLMATRVHNLHAPGSCPVILFPCFRLLFNFLVACCWFAQCLNSFPPFWERIYRLLVRS